MGELMEIEAIKGEAEVFAFFEDGEPTQSALETFQAKFLEQAAIVSHRSAPLVIVIGLIDRRIRAPPAAADAADASDDTGGEGGGVGHLAGKIEVSAPMSSCNLRPPCYRPQVWWTQNPGHEVAKTKL